MHAAHTTTTTAQHIQAGDHVRLPCGALEHIAEANTVGQRVYLRTSTTPPADGWDLSLHRAQEVRVAR